MRKGIPKLETCSICQAASPAGTKTEARCLTITDSGLQSQHRLGNGRSIKKFGCSLHDPLNFTSIFTTIQHGQVDVEISCDALRTNQRPPTTTQCPEVKNQGLGDKGLMEAMAQGANRGVPHSWGLGA